MISRSAPLRRSQKRIRKRRKVKLSSLRYEVISGSFRLYPDGREVCLENAAGQVEYRIRTVQMFERQKRVCGLEASGNCMYRGVPMTLTPGLMGSATFEHGDKRGLGGARRNDSTSALGNCAVHAACNSHLGSRRI